MSSNYTELPINNTGLTDDILGVIFQMLLISDIRNHVSFTRVCKRWNKITCESSLWKEFVLQKWPHLATSKKIKNWKSVAVRRIQTTKKDQPPIIENCDIADSNLENQVQWKFKCPLDWNNLSVVSEFERFCAVCNKSVYLCESIEELTQNVSSKRCVAFQPSKIKRYGLPASIHVVGPPHSGKTTFISHFKTTREEEDAMYLQSPPWKLPCDGTTTVKQNEKYELYFSEIHQMELNDNERPIAIVLYKADSYSQDEATNFASFYNCPVLFIANSPGSSFKKVKHLLYKADVSDPKQVQQIVAVIAECLWTNYDDVPFENFGFVMGKLVPVHEGNSEELDAELSEMTQSML